MEGASLAIRRCRRRRTSLGSELPLISWETPSKVLGCPGPCHSGGQVVSLLVIKWHLGFCLQGQGSNSHGSNAFKSLAGGVPPLTPHSPQQHRLSPGPSTQISPSIDLGLTKWKKASKKVSSFFIGWRVTTEEIPGPWALNHFWNGTVAFLNWISSVGFLWTKEQGLYLPLSYPPSQEQDQTPMGYLVKPRIAGQTDRWMESGPGSADPTLVWPGFFFPILHLQALTLQGNILVISEPHILPLWASAHSFIINLHEVGSPSGSISSFIRNKNRLLQTFQSLGHQFIGSVQPWLRFFPLSSAPWLLGHSQLVDIVTWFNTACFFFRPFQWPLDMKLSRDTDADQPGTSNSNQGIDHQCQSHPSWSITWSSFRRATTLSGGSHGSLFVQVFPQLTHSTLAVLFI